MDLIGKTAVVTGAGSGIRSGYMFGFIEIRC